ncbi:hypothetical protein [Acinetobacter rathckeae]|uniref:hypothetical protein n=1 Tax=Acinetobacter rathckeae TaxID=2605272 RepID=UPI0018A31A0A|nr:hypothetical protein [Acinetobacter rathckeae]MBF7695864.1 hypothetical protein [Acinetobacter rathckeae]
MSNDLNLDSLQPTTDKILSTENRSSNNDTTSSKNLDKEVQNDFMFARLIEAEKLEAQKQKYRHTEDEHDLRKEQLKFLSGITKYWIGFITVVSLLQGFKGYDLRSKFELTDMAFITLIATTTGTVLGLYTIGAVWLYKTRKEEKKEEKAPTSE